MISVKSQDQIEKLIEGGRILSSIIKILMQNVKQGISTAQLDKMAKDMMIEKGGVPSFEGFRSGPDDPPFPTTICASLNEQIVHAPASKNVILKSGDILSIDIGMKYKGCFTDMAVTVPVGKISKEAKRLMQATKKSLDLAINVIKPGGSIGDIGKVIEDYAHKRGYAVVRDLVGHGVGNAVHEDPKIPNFHLPENDKIKLMPGMVLAVEPMLTAGDFRISCADDGWTISTRDGSLSAHFEHTIIVTEKGNKVATAF